MHKDNPNFLSAVIITKNEEEIVAACIESLLPVADEILVVDSYSTDNTRQICLSFSKVRFIEHDWQGYAGTKNYANSQATYDWILSLDADEALSTDLQQAILKVKDMGGGGRHYSFARLTRYCGRWIKHGGWYPDVKFRLFDRRHARWEGNYVHEELKADSGIKPILLDGDCLHYSINSVEQHLAQVNRFSSLSAQDKFARGKKAGLLKLAFSPWSMFIKMYFLKAGFLDGRHGLIIAVISAHSRFLRYAKLYMLHREK